MIAKSKGASAQQRDEGRKDRVIYDRLVLERLKFTTMYLNVVCYLSAWYVWLSKACTTALRKSFACSLSDSQVLVMIEMMFKFGRCVFKGKGDLHGIDVLANIMKKHEYPEKKADSRLIKIFFLLLFILWSTVAICILILLKCRPILMQN